MNVCRQKRSVNYFDRLSSRFGRIYLHSQCRSCSTGHPCAASGKILVKNFPGHKAVRDGWRERRRACRCGQEEGCSQLQHFLGFSGPRHHEGSLFLSPFCRFVLSLRHIPCLVPPACIPRLNTNREDVVEGNILHVLRRNCGLSPTFGLQFHADVRTQVRDTFPRAQHARDGVDDMITL
jgi:hypothetical protein